MPMASISSMKMMQAPYLLAILRALLYSIITLMLPMPMNMLWKLGEEA